MADIAIPDVSFRSPQQAGTEFPVKVSVENNEAVAPAYPSPALCSGGIFKPDGHRVNVTLTIKNEKGREAFTNTKEICATVEQPSNVLGDTHATFTPKLKAGTYTVHASAEAMPSGSATAQPRPLEVKGKGGLPESTADTPGFEEPGNASSGSQSLVGDLVTGRSKWLVAGGAILAYASVQGGLFPEED